MVVFKRRSQSLGKIQNRKGEGKVGYKGKKTIKDYNP